MFLVSRLEQFHRCPRNWCWHSWMAIWIPWIAEAVTSGLRMHTSSWRRVNPGSVRHTVLALRMGSILGSFRPKISLESALRADHTASYRQEKTHHRASVLTDSIFIGKFTLQALKCFTFLFIDFLIMCGTPCLFNATKIQNLFGAKFMLVTSLLLNGTCEEKWALTSYAWYQAN